MMENILKEINAVLGVMGSFVCLSDGTVAAQALPESVDGAKLELVARIASQTFQAREISGQRVSEVELVYQANRLSLRNLRGGILAILCSRTISVPLLSFTANQAVKKLTGELKLFRSPASRPDQTPADLAPREPAQVLGRKAAASPLVRELDQEVHRLDDAAREKGLTLRALDSLAIWLSCPNSRALIDRPDQRQMGFAAPLAQRDPVLRLFEQAGYRSNDPFDESAANHRIHLADAQRELKADIFFDILELDYRLDLTLLLHQAGGVFSPTTLLLTRLQMLALNETALREICALLLERDLSLESQADKNNTSQIAEYCLNDQNLAQTILKNLGQVATYAPGALATSDQAIVVERAQRLARSINSSLLLLLSHSRSSSWRTR